MLQVMPFRSTTAICLAGAFWLCACRESHPPTLASTQQTNVSANPAGLSVQIDHETQDGNATQPVAKTATTDDEKPLVESPVAATKRNSSSLGSVVDGSLRDGARLAQQGPGFRRRPDKPLTTTYGVDELVFALQQAARGVGQAYPGSELTIGDIALEIGGPLDGHASHQSGRDVDVMFYLLNDEKQPVAGRAIPIEPDGHGYDYNDLAKLEDDERVWFDVDRNTDFIFRLLAEPSIEVQRIFLADHLRSTIAKRAASLKLPKEVQARFLEVTCQPKFPHDDHFHIRIYCDAADIAEGCPDMPPIFSWHKARLREQNVAAKLAGRPKPSRAKQTSMAQAKAQAGTLHPEVEAFLQRRKTWAEPSASSGPSCKM